MKRILVLFLSLFCLQVFGQNSAADRDYLQAEIYFKDGLYDKARNSIDQYVVDDGDIPKANEFRNKLKECQDIYSTAESFYLAKMYTEALSQYEKLKKSNPTHPDLDSKIVSCRKAIENANNEQNKPDMSSNRGVTNSSASTKRHSFNPLKPEGFTIELGVIGGTNLGLSLDFTASYFLIGVGVDWIMIRPKRTIITNLVNSGYTGNFTKSTTIKISGSCTNVFLDLGVYFKYFSVSCQIGLLCGTTVDKISLYRGSGYGLIDGDVHRYWGSYKYYDFSDISSRQELHMTLTPQIKGYIPIGRKKMHSISLGLGYTFVPTLGYNAGFSGNLGIHFRF